MGAVGPRRPLHDIHPCYWIWATCTHSTAKVARLWNNVEPFRIDEIHVGRPNRMEDQPDLGKIETLKTTLEFKSTTAENQTIPWSPRLGADPSESRTVSNRPNGHSGEGGSAQTLWGILGSMESVDRTWTRVEYHTRRWVNGSLASAWESRR